ncbi:MAG: anti-sigma factor antagonist [Anaerolineae bacterium]|nr:anti-sigma factor antagonist [Phycisphaerae bacterium]
MSETAPVPAVTIEKRGSALIATINARLLDDKELKLLSSILDEAAADSSVSLIVVNMERVQLVPSLALGLLLRISQKCESRKQALTLAALSPQVRKMFSITKLDRILKMSDTVDTALAEQA